MLEGLDLLFCFPCGDSMLFLSYFSSGSFPDSDVNHLNGKSVLLFMHGKQNTSGFLGSYQSISKLYRFYQLGGTNKSVRPNKTTCLKSLIFHDIY